MRRQYLFVSKIQIEISITDSRSTILKLLLLSAGIAAMKGKIGLIGAI